MDTMMSNVTFVICIFALIAIVNISAQVAEPRNGCTYTFTVPREHFESQCMTDEIRQNLQEIRRENKQILTENASLKQQIENLTKEYGYMVDTVKTLEKETASWREVIEWPSLDRPFTPEGRPEDIKAVDDEVYDDCYRAVRRSAKSKAGIYNIKPAEDQLPFLAFCDENGWTVLLRRFDGHVDFYRSWSEYSGGFGEVSGEMWLGLEYVHLLTANKKYQLRMEALGWNNNKMYTAEHDHFEVDTEQNLYRLSIGNMSGGNVEDAMREISGVQFTSRDRDNDQWYQGNCAEHYRSGWWLNNCGWDPNRPWCSGNGCMTWGDTHIKKIVLKIRPMVAKGVELTNRSKAANVKPPRSKAPRPKKEKKVKVNKKPKQQNQQG